MTSGMRTSMGVLIINTICTLKCKKCITQTPFHKQGQNYPIENLINEMRLFFQIYDEVDHFDFEGGETLLHPNIVDLIGEALQYKKQYKTLNILTNGTILPSQEILEACKNQPVFFIIDNYGDLSRHKEELIELLTHHGINYRIDTYHGEDQYYGGWVDFGDFSFKNYTPAQVEHVFENCRSGNCGAPYIKNGKMYLCPVQASLKEEIQLIEGEYVDLTNDSMSIEDKKKAAERFGSHFINACNYCLGFNVNSKRIPAAIQLTEEDLRNLKKNVVN